MVARMFGLNLFVGTLIFMRVSDRNDNNKAVQRNHPIKHIKKIDHLFPPVKNKHTVDCDALTNGYQRRPATKEEA